MSTPTHSKEREELLERIKLLESQVEAVSIGHEHWRERGSAFEEFFLAADDMEKVRKDCTHEEQRDRYIQAKNKCEELLGFHEAKSAVPTDRGGKE